MCAGFQLWYLLAQSDCDGCVFADVCCEDPKCWLEGASHDIPDGGLEFTGGHLSRGRRVTIGSFDPILDRFFLIASCLHTTATGRRWMAEDFIFTSMVVGLADGQTELNCACTWSTCVCPQRASRSTLGKTTITVMSSSSITGRGLWLTPGTLCNLLMTAMLGVSAGGLRIDGIAAANAGYLHANEWTNHQELCCEPMPAIICVGLYRRTGL